MLQQRHLLVGVCVCFGPFASRAKGLHSSQDEKNLLHMMPALKSAGGDSTGRAKIYRHNCSSTKMGFLALLVVPLPVLLSAGIM